MSQSKQRTMRMHSYCTPVQVFPKDQPCQLPQSAYCSLLPTETKECTYSSVLFGDTVESKPDLATQDRNGNEDYCRPRGEITSLII